MAGTPSLNALFLFYLFFVLAVWARRIVWIKKFRQSQPPLPAIEKIPDGFQTPKVSVIVPAKDEQKNITNCLDCLFKQNYPHLEMIVVDDRSSDRTPEILAGYQKKSPSFFKVVRIEKLPPGWTGKNHAMFVGSRAASGDWLLFTDADTTHRPWSIFSAVVWAEKNGVDFLTLAPETTSHSFWEKAVQPLAAQSLALWFDPLKINDPKNPVLANGQFILVRRPVYEKTGGNESVKTEVVEDVALARRTRAKGFRVKFLDGTALYSTRMYASLAEIHRGWTRILTYLFDKKLGAIFHKIFLFLFFSIAPFVLVFLEGLFYWVRPEVFSAPVLALAAAASLVIVMIRFAGNRMVRTNPWFAFLHPVGSAVMVWILFSCVFRIVLKRPSPWRGDLHR